MALVSGTGVDWLGPQVLLFFFGGFFSCQLLSSSLLSLFPPKVVLDVASTGPHMETCSAEVVEHRSSVLVI